MENIIGIVKLQNGNVRLYAEDGKSFTTVEAGAKLVITQDNKSIQLRQQNQAHEYLKHKDIQYTQILPAAQVAFDPNSADIFALKDFLDVNFFFEVTGGGGGSVAGAENGLYVSGGNVRLGGALLEDTVVVENGFDFVQVRTKTIATADVTTAHRSRIANPFVLQGWTENSLVRSMFVEDASASAATVGVAGNNTEQVAAFLRAGNAAGSIQSYIIVQPQEISQTIWRFGVISSRNTVSGAQHLLDYKTQIQTIQPEVGSVVQVTRYSIEVDIATVTANQILATIAMEANCQYSVEAVINFRRTNLLGAGGARFFGGASRSSAFGNTLYSNNPNVVVLENVTGNPSFGHNIVATDYNILVSNSSAIKTRYSVVITITKTIITDTF